MSEPPHYNEKTIKCCAFCHASLWEDLWSLKMNCKKHHKSVKGNGVCDDYA